MLASVLYEYIQHKSYNRLDIYANPATFFSHASHNFAPQMGYVNVGLSIPHLRTYLPQYSHAFCYDSITLGTAYPSHSVVQFCTEICAIFNEHTV